jgi:hypothetical protein
MLGRTSLCVGLVCLSVAGCQRAQDPAVLEQRQKYLLSEEPQGALSVMEARAKVAAAAAPAEPLVLMGRVGAGAHQTWDPGKAAFVVIDPSAEMPSHDHAGGHDDNCPFCQAEKQAVADSTALVRVTDETGQVVAIDARELFSIVEGQIVVVRGTASIDALGNLVVAAQGVYARR